MCVKFDSWNFLGVNWWSQTTKFFQWWWRERCIATVIRPGSVTYLLKDVIYNICYNYYLKKWFKYFLCVVFTYKKNSKYYKSFQRRREESRSNRAKTASVRFIAAKRPSQTCDGDLARPFWCSFYSNLFGLFEGVYVCIWVDVKSPPGRHMKERYLHLKECLHVWVCVRYDDDDVPESTGFLCHRTCCKINRYTDLLRGIIFEPVMAIFALHFDVPSRTDCFTVFMCAPWPSVSMLNTRLSQTYLSQPNILILSSK